jgi:hypothetical protein
MAISQESFTSSGQVATSKNSPRAYAHPPFTNEEVFRALAAFLPPEILEEADSVFPGNPGDPFLGHVTTHVLLIMSTFSDELAGRVIAYTPDLETQVKEVLSDPEGYLQSLRDDMPGLGSPDEPQEEQ